MEGGITPELTDYGYFSTPRSVAEQTKDSLSG